MRLMNSEAANYALGLLSMLAMLDSSSLPLSLFEEAWRGTRADIYTDTFNSCTDWRSAYSQIIPNLPRFLGADHDTWDAFAILEAIHLLESYSLLKLDISGNSQSISTHPLTHAWAKDRQDIVTQQDSWRLSGSMLHTSCATDHHHFWTDHGDKIIPHSVAILTAETQILGQPTSLAVSILHQCGMNWMKTDISKLDGALQIRDRLISWAKPDSRIVDAQWLPLYYLFGIEMIKIGGAMEAVAILEDVVIMGKPQLPDEHPHRRSWTCALAYSYLYDHKVAEARSLLEDMFDNGKFIISAGFMPIFIALCDVCKQVGNDTKLISILKKTIEEHYALAQTRHWTS